jgi:hypothetical protein
MQNVVIGGSLLLCVGALVAITCMIGGALMILSCVHSGALIKVK